MGSADFLITDNNPSDLDQLLQFIKDARGFDYSGYKQNTLARRIERRMHVRGLKTYEEYRDYLEIHQEEFQELFNSVLLNVTSFFRDKEPWEYLQKEILPKLLKERSQSEHLRAWVAGCASGEEAFSLAMCLAELMGVEEYRARTKIYATDLDEHALSQCRVSNYSEKDLENVPADFREKYFTKSEGRFTINSEMRRPVVFGRHDLINDAPISRVDLLLCRNTIMYFNADTQEKILNRFHFALNDGGYLMLGTAETVLSSNSLFVPISTKQHIFAKVTGTRIRQRGFMVTSQRGAVLPQNEIHTKVREAAFEAAPVAQIVIDEKANLAGANESARKAFVLGKRDMGRPIQDLNVSFQPIELRNGLQKAYESRQRVLYKDVKHISLNGTPVVYDISVTPLYSLNSELLGASIAFEDVTHTKRLQDDLLNFNQELETAYEEVQSTNEELQTTNEELQSTVEELETTNEELQSTNEELETTNEELQSANEELETVNQEMQQSTDELGRSNAFLNSILESLRDGVIVVNRELQVVAWNSKSEDLWGLRPQEVLGKHLLNLDIGLPVQDLRDPVRNSIAQSQSVSMAIESTTRRGRKVRLIVLCNPLLGSEGECRGAIILTREN